MTTRCLLPLCLAAAVLSGCQDNQPPADAPGTEAPTLDVTHWTAETELFMEHPPLVAGQTIRFAVHLTRLADFSALNAGRPAIEMVPEAGGAPTTLPGTDPLRPGAFRVEGKLPAAGRYRWTLTVTAPGLSDRHDLGVATVFGDQSAANADAETRTEGDATAITYLKEQQWTNPFATAPVADGDVRTSVRVPASVEPITGGEAFVSAPADGRFAADSLPSVGQVVAPGQSLGRLEPRLTDGADRASLLAAVAEAQVGLEGAQAERERAERLLVDRAVPARRVDDAKRAEAVADARLTAARARLAQRDEVLGSGGGAASGNAFVLRAPIGGRVADVYAVVGGSYDEGARLFRIVRTDRVEIRAHIPSDVKAARSVTALSFEVPGQPDAIPLRPDRVHDAGVVDPQTRALPLQIEVANPSGQLLVGQSGIAVLYTAGTERMTVVPRAAVLMEAGRPYVFVQLGGEQFGRRPVEVTSRDGDLMGIRTGVRTGERVVTRGAYDIQLASAAKGLPAEGHVH